MQRKGGRGPIGTGIGREENGLMREWKGERKGAEERGLPIKNRPRAK